jgi:hypothetical protein
MQNPGQEMEWDLHFHCLQVKEVAVIGSQGCLPGEGHAHNAVHLDPEASLFNPRHCSTSATFCQLPLGADAPGRQPFQLDASTFACSCSLGPSGDLRRSFAPSSNP